MSQPRLSRFEAGRVDVVSLAEVGCLIDALGIRLDFAARPPFVASTPFQQDAAHARVSAYVARRFQAMGWEVRTEVEIVEGTSRGWIDLIAYNPSLRALFVGEVKAGLDDLGSSQRQLGWYVRAALAVNRSLGWRVDRDAAALLVLATASNDDLISANHGLMHAAFPTRATDLFGWLEDPSRNLSGWGVALVDPRSRRRKWLLPIGLDGRRTPLRYASYADFMRMSRVRQLRR